MSRHPENIILVASIEAENAVGDLGRAVPLEDRVRAAMRAVYGHWLCTDEDSQFVAACEGLARSCSEEERERIVGNLKALAKVGALLGAAQAGVPLDVAALAEEMAEDRERVAPLGLRKLWAEVRRGGEDVSG